MTKAYGGPRKSPPPSRRCRACREEYWVDPAEVVGVKRGHWTCPPCQRNEAWERRVAAKHPGAGRVAPQGER